MEPEPTFDSSAIRQGLNLINFHPDATGFTIGTTTTTTTTRAFTYAAVYAADSRSVCVAFDVDNALPDPTLDIYLPEGFRSGGCPFEANATLFPECLGELPAPSLDAISCKEMWDGRMLSYYLHISVAGMANASGFAGYALQLDLRAPRIMPRANIWKLDMRSSDHKVAKLQMQALARAVVWDMLGVARLCVCRVGPKACDRSFLRLMSRLWRASCWANGLTPASQPDRTEVKKCFRVIPLSLGQAFACDDSVLHACSRQMFIPGASAAGNLDL